MSKKRLFYIGFFVVLALAFYFVISISISWYRLLRRTLILKFFIAAGSKILADMHQFFSLLNNVMQYK